MQLNADFTDSVSVVTYRNPQSIPKARGSNENIIYVYSILSNRQKGENEAEPKLQGSNRVGYPTLVQRIKVGCQ